MLIERPIRFSIMLPGFRDQTKAILAPLCSDCHVHPAKIARCLKILRSMYAKRAGRQVHFTALRRPPVLPPARRPGEAEELLSDLLDVLFGLRGDAWSAVAAAVPAELQQRIDRSFGLS
jgi:hypothetical protein